MPIRKTLLLASIIVSCTALLAGCGNKDDDKRKRRERIEADVAKDKAIVQAAKDKAAAAAKDKAAKDKAAAIAAVATMANCPSSVEGATTKLSNSKTAVILEITAAAATAAAEIRLRAARLVKLSADGYTGSADRSDALAKCPVVMIEGAIDAAEIDHGVKVTIEPKDPAKLDAVGAEAADRITKLD